MEESRTQKLHQLLKRLGTALHGSVVDSDEVQECLRELHEAGWDAVMMLEASVVCRPDGEIEPGQASLHVHADPRPRSRVEYRMNLHDAAFLASLGISPTRYRSNGAPGRAADTDDSPDR